MLRFARRVVGQKTVQPWKGVGAGRCEPEVAMLTGMELRKTWCPRAAIGGGMVVADEAGRGGVAGRADGGSGSSGRGKELAGADDGREAEGDGETTSADAGAVGGGDIGKWRVHKG